MGKPPHNGRPKLDDIINIVNLDSSNQYPKSMSLPEFLDAPEAAERLGVRRATLYAYVSRGFVRATDDPNDPHRRLYNVADIEALAGRRGRGEKRERAAAGALHWGLPVLSSRITLIENGRLFYRGRDAAELAVEASLEEVARLLWNCCEDNPFAGPAPQVDPAWMGLAEALAGLTIVERATALLPLVQNATTLTWQRETRRLWPGATGLLRAITAAATGKSPTAEPAHEALARAWGLNASGADLVRAALILLADHELNASTFAVRVVASTGASLAAALASGLSALSGPMHGGATSLVEVFFDEVERNGSATKVIEERLWRGDRLPGFDHPLYPDGDPRAKVLLPLLPGNAVREDMLAALDEMGKRPNIDFALVSLRRALALPRGAALTLFAVGRSAGWIAHALEQREDGMLIRPRARYLPAEGG
jgi:citrate synthase